MTTVNSIISEMDVELLLHWICNVWRSIIQYENHFTHKCLLLKHWNDAVLQNRLIAFTIHGTRNNTDGTYLFEKNSPTIRNFFWATVAESPILSNCCTSKAQIFLETVITMFSYAMTRILFSILWWVNAVYYWNFEVLFYVMPFLTSLRIFSSNFRSASM